MYRTRSFRESEVYTSYHVSKGRSVNFPRERPGSLYTLVHVDTRETDRRGWEHRLSQAGVALKWRISPRRCDRPPVTKRNYARQEMHYRSSPQPPEHSLSSSSSFSFSSSPHLRTATTHLCTATENHPRPIGWTSKIVESIDPFDTFYSMTTRVTEDGYLSQVHHFLLLFAFDSATVAR